MNHQLIQSDKSSTTNGSVEFGLNGVLSRVHITRAHLEEDVGNNTHVERHGGVSDCDREKGMNSLSGVRRALPHPAGAHAGPL